MILQQEQVGLISSGLQQRPRNLASGGVPRVQNAAVGVTAFLSEDEPPADFVELHTVADEIGDRVIALFDDAPHYRLVTEAGTGIKGIDDVTLDRISIVPQLVREHR